MTAADETMREARRLAASHPVAALEIARAAIAADPREAEAHRVAALAFRALGQDEEAERAEIDAIDASVHDAELREAGAALAANALHLAEPILRARLKAMPYDVAAIRMLAEVAGRIGRNRDAEALLRRALELAPAFHAARSNLAIVLHRQHRTEEALAELSKLIAADPDNPGYANLKAAALGRVGEFDEALALYESILGSGGSKHPKLWMSYGHTLKTVGRQDDSIRAYRAAVALQPGLGEGWWSLANLKTVRFEDTDVAAMETALASGGLSEEDRFHLEFALGKAHEDRRDAARAFAHYAAGNAGRRAVLPYDADEFSRPVDRAIDLFDTDFFAARAGWGHEAPDPIFILGMPRAGSTLIEQILSSHSQVEGTMELPDIPALVARSAEGGQYPEALSTLARDTATALGADYLARTRIQRKEAKPFFIDKLPNNWLHVGLIHLILPNARIIDARRHPLDCCFSNFKQHFARGQSFSYGLEDLGRYYADYVRLMAHVDAVLPGRVHRVIHERLLDDPEGETRAMLQVLGLPFEEACLSFHENQRAVRTASSEQVRRPINRDGVGQWQPYEAWLDPLKRALGAALDSYPGAPAL
jgi:tetratricopeptide (TPR) repeat protein